MTIKDYKAATEELRSTVADLQWAYSCARVDAHIAGLSEWFWVMMSRHWVREWLGNKSRIRFNLPL